MTKVLDHRDLLTPVTFAEEEARFLAGVVVSRIDDYNDTQAEIAQRIAGKFILAAQVKKDELIERHGREAVLDLAERCMDEYPDAVLTEGL